MEVRTLKKAFIKIDTRCPVCGAKLFLKTTVSIEPGFHSDTAVFYCKNCGYELTKSRDDWQIAEESDSVGVKWE